LLWKRSWIEAANLLLALTILNHPVAGSIVMSARRECVMSGVFIFKGPTRSTQTVTPGQILHSTVSLKNWFLQKKRKSPEQLWSEKDSF
jgi:hypothetical protein